MKQFHEFSAGADEDEHIAVLHFAIHLLMYQSAQRTDSLAHICPAGAQEVAHRVVQVKHGSPEDFGSTVSSTASQIRSRNGHEVHWGRAKLHPEALVLPRSIPWRVV